MVTLETLKKSVGKKNSKSKIFAWLADLERAAGDLDTALNRVDGGLTLYSNDVAAMIVRAKILFQKEDFEGCVQQCDKILVKDPFNLAAQKIMGDAYDKLGNVAERNLCYRRYHDMDPLNNFWKDEYDVVLDVAAATAGVLADDAFSMPSEGEESLDLNLGGDDLFQKSVEDEAEAAPAAAADDSFSMGGSSSPFEKSNDSFDLSLDDAPEESSSSFAAPAEEKSSSLFGNFDVNAEDDVPEENASAEEVADDDPFAALAAMLPNGDADDDSALEELSASLDSAMDSIAAGETVGEEQFPADDNISGNDVNSALADMFGLDDDLEVEESVAPAPAEVVLDEEAAANATSIFGAPQPADEDKPMSVNNAFDSIFGEDELPEEKPQPAASEWSPAPAAAEESEGGLFEKSASSEIFGSDEIEPAVEEPAKEAPAALDEDKPTTVDNAFDSIFGEDELPEEKPQPAASEWSPAPAADEPTLEEPALEESALEEPALEEPAAALNEDKPTTVDNAFDSIFGEDELPEEKPVETSSAEAVFGKSGLFEKSADFSIFEKSAEVEPAPAVEEPESEALTLDESAFDEAALDVANLLEEPVLAEPAAAPAAEAPVEEAPAAEPAESKSSEVADAFGSIFGDDDDLPEEKPQAAADEWSVDAALAAEIAEPAAEDSTDELTLEEPATVAEVETPVDPVIASPMDFVFEDDAPKSEESEAPAAESTVAVDSAFASIFGDDDDLPVEEPAPVVEEPVDDRTLAEKVDSAEAELELPSTEEKTEVNDIAQEMGGAFASMFGNDDDLDLPDVKTSSATDQESTGAAIEEVAATVASGEAKSDLDKSFDSLFGNDDALDLPEDGKKAEAPAVAADLNPLESEVSGAFKGLFDMDDDAFEEPKPTNKGVDFLMSGDSDDEVSASLINNPDAPLDRGSHELDESLNTRTLAEIYFDQGLYGKALDIYADLAQKEPENAEIAARLGEIEKLYRTKFGGEA